MTTAEQLRNEDKLQGKLEVAKNLILMRLDIGQIVKATMSTIEAKGALSYLSIRRMAIRS